MLLFHNFAVQNVLELNITSQKIYKAPLQNRTSNVVPKSPFFMYLKIYRNKRNEYFFYFTALI